MIVMMMKKYKTNKCHKFVTLMRLWRNDDDDDDNDDDEEMQNE